MSKVPPKKQYHRYDFMSEIPSAIHILEKFYLTTDITSHYNHSDWFLWRFTSTKKKTYFLPSSSLNWIHILSVKRLMQCDMRNTNKRQRN